MEAKSPYADFDPKTLIGKTYNSYDFSLTPTEVILYALSVGCQQDPLNKDHLKFTYENDGDFQSFPTMACALGLRTFGDFAKYPGFPKIDLDQVLHGEEEVEIIKPLKADGTVYVCTHTYKDFQDKGKMSNTVAEKLFFEKDTKELCVRITNHCIIRQFGGYGYKGTMPSVIGAGKVERPKREPDQVRVEKTQANQAILYRLNGDTNPLHIDPKVAQKVKFDRPILHGLCSFGFSCKSLLDTYSNNDPTTLKKLSARFTSHVYPGETLIVEMWKEPNTNRVYFETKTKERNLMVMKGFAEFKESPKL
ncbi:hypothetical protein FGO68_gene3846 [Halteria grandinella]|uniref:MaoC-like domain-containing protein n=1 Tax=Halteria grandinella TaxID=5974 RepID=A0A8J8SZF6_HALGN|nr:hypothetical protein FGO68_gene3846 [Halteria grandinella]